MNSMIGNNPIYVMGTSPGGPQDWLPLERQLLQTADVVYGSRRALNHIADGPAKYVITPPLQLLADHMRAHSECRRLVMATGDPSFFGIAEFLYRAFGKDSVVVVPHVSSIQRAFAKVKMSWHDAFFGSVHGRTLEPVITWTLRHTKVAVLTDPDRHAGRIAQTLVDAELPEVRMFVCENLDTVNELITEATAQELQGQPFGGYAVVILLNPEAGYGRFGIDDSMLLRRDDQPGMVTKKPIRAISIAQLGIHQHSVLWDIGAGTGSLAIDASRIIGVTGRIFAIERNPRDFRLLTRNVRGHRAAVTPVMGEAPEIFEQLPDPDAVFIGGTGGRLEAVVAGVCERLKPGNMMVLNLVRLDHVLQIEKILPASCSWRIRMVQTSLLDSQMKVPRFQPDNPVFIVSVKKPMNGDY